MRETKLRRRSGQLRHQELHHGALTGSAGLQAAICLVESHYSSPQLSGGKLSRLPNGEFSRGVRRMPRRLAACHPGVPAGSSCASSSFLYIHARAPSNLRRLLAFPQ